MSALKRTPLRDFHAAHGARLVDFAGWEMPVQYRSILEEHRAVRRAAGLFDVSHMGEIEVRGPQALQFLDTLLTNEVARLFPGHALYSPMCRDHGGTVDDLIVYQRAPQDYLLCVNAANLAKDLDWMRTVAADLEVTITDRSNDYALLALQGPHSATILQTLTGAKLDAIHPFHFREGGVAGVHCLISRTGYTGEDGFELYHAAADAPALAEALLEAGRPHGLVLAGLGARDSLRLEAGYPLYGHELSEAISPIAAGLAWTFKPNKTIPCRGRDALLREKQHGPSRRVVFFRTGDRRILRADTPLSVGPDGPPAGRVLSGTLSPILNEAIGSALVETTLADKPLCAEVRGDLVRLQIVRPPLVPLRQS